MTINAAMYWTARRLANGTWQFEDGWNEQAQAERAAKFYRREHHKRCIVVVVPFGEDKKLMLRKTLAA